MKANEINPLDTTLITPAELRARWKVSMMFLHRARRAGKLPFLKIGRHTRFRLADVEAFERGAAV
jgi:excisionase family DNA binding protein